MKTKIIKGTIKYRNKSKTIDVEKWNKNWKNEDL